jgi:hypothetical protein
MMRKTGEAYHARLGLDCEKTQKRKGFEHRKAQKKGVEMITEKKKKTVR